MSNLMKKSLLLAAIVAAFQQNESATELLVTEDGNCFLPTNKSYADAHAKRTNQKVKTYLREDFETEIAKAEATAKEKETKSAGEGEKTAESVLSNAGKGTKGSGKGKPKADSEKETGQEGGHTDDKA